MGERLRSLLSELKRRKVYRVVVAYAVVGWAVATGAEYVFDLLEYPVSAARFIAIVILLGFPIALVLAWAYELRPETRSGTLPPPEPGPTGTEGKAPPEHAIPAKGIHIQTLGGIRVFRDGEEITALPRKPVRCALLAYIAVERNPPKEKALGLLWPDKDPELARKSLNQTLTELRKDLGDQWVDSSGPFLVLREDIGTDLAPFQSAVRESRWDEALKHYHGPFLEGFFLSGSYDFGEWQAQVGGRVRLSQRKAHTRLIEERHKSRAIPEALGLAKSWADQAPLDDEAQNWFIRLLAETGQRGAALKHADQFLERLRRDEEDPLDETLALIEDIKTGDVGPGRPWAWDRKVHSPLPSEIPPPPSPFPEPGPLPQPPQPILERFVTWMRERFLLLTATVPVIIVLYFILKQVIPIGPELDPHRVVGFPLFDQRTEISEGVGIPAILAAAMENARPLVWTDGWVRLPEEQRRDVVSLSPGQARGIARDRGAGSYLLGSIFEVNDQTAVTLRLYDTRKDTVIAQSTAFGPVSEASAGTLALQALLEILPPLLDPGREIDLSYLQDRQPGALARWIQGEREYRFARFELALGHLKEAVALDSLLAPAALKGAQAAGWHHQTGEAQELLELAVRHDSLLAPRQAALARGLLAYRQGQPDSAVAHIRRAIDLAEEWSEAWTALGETFYHQIPTGIQIPDSAEHAFRRSWELDRGFVPPLIHLTELEMRNGNLREAGRDIRLIRSSDADTVNAVRLSLMLRCIQDGLSPEEWKAEAQRDSSAVLGAGMMLAAAGTHVTCAEGAMGSLLGHSHRDWAWDALLGTTGLLLAQGKDKRAGELLDSAYTAGERAVPFLLLLGAAAGAELNEGAASLDSMVVAGRGPDYAGISPRTARALGIWHAVRGNTDKLATLATRTRERAEELDSTPESEVSPEELSLARRLSTALAGHLALARGDTFTGLAQLRSAIADAPQRHLAWDSDNPMGYERIRLAEVLLRQGRYREAVQQAQVFDHPEPVTFLFFLPTSLAVRHVAALALGDRELAEECETRLKSLGRADLISSLSPRITQQGGNP